jgi:hypothetical protein
MSHPSSCTNPDCTLSYREHLLTIGYSSSAFPTRLVNRTPGLPDEPLTQTNIRERRWDRDMSAFKRLIAQGVCPPQMEGSALRERRGETREDIERRQVTLDYSDPT